MTTPSITPEQIKAIAAAIRACELDRLGAKLPNSTALNAITRALGLGADFRAFKAGLTTPEGPQATSLAYSCILFVFANRDTDSELCDDDTTADLLSALSALGLTGELLPSAHGYCTLHCSTSDPQMTLEQLENRHSHIVKLVSQMTHKGEIPAPLGSTLWQVRTDTPVLVVNFRYFDNDQVCSSNITETAWRARHRLGLGDEATLLLLGGDCEIEAHYGGSDITVEDVMREVVFYHD